MRPEYSEQLIMIGRNIARCRKLRGMRQKDLAEKLGVATSYIGQIEAEHLAKSFSLDKLFMIADALSVPVEELFMMDKD